VLDTTGENILINAILSTTQVSVQRAVGTTVAQAIAGAVNIFQVGTAFEESSLRPNALAINPVRVTNLTQIFRNTWAVSDSVRATQVIAGESNVAENRQDCAAFHAADIEKGIFFGQKFSGSRNGQPFRAMDGIYSIVSNLAYYPPSYSAANVDCCWWYHETTRSSRLLSIPPLTRLRTRRLPTSVSCSLVVRRRRSINNIGRLNGTYYMMDGQTSWGLQFSTVKIARGTFRIIEHPLFNTNSSWGKLAIAVDLSSFNLAYLGDRKTMNKEFNMTGSEAADNGIDAVGGTLTTELTTIIRNPPAFSIMTNLTAGAAG
jgi:hypothetical protein